MIEDAEKEYYKWHQKKADAIDEYVEYMLHNKDTWGYIQPLDRWDEVIEAFERNALQRGYSKEGFNIGLTILRTGTFKNKRIDVDDITYKTRSRNYNWPNNGADLKNVREAYNRRLFHAYMATYSPEAFEVSQAQDIIAFHGTQAISLPSIINAGSLLSHGDQYRAGILTASGEPFPVARRREFISFGALHHTTGLRYADSDVRSFEQQEYLRQAAQRNDGYQLRLEETETFDKRLHELIEAGDEFLEYAEMHRFGVLFGLSRNAMWSAGIDPAIGRELEVTSDVNELSFAHRVGLKFLPVVVAPEEHIHVLNGTIPDTMKIISRESIARALYFTKSYGFSSN